MNKLIHPYEGGLDRKINAIHPKISNSLDQINSVPPSIALRVLKELVNYACQATHSGAIGAGRRAMAKLPPEWLEQNLVKAVEAQLNLDDDWEFRRLLELLEIVRPSMMARFIEPAMLSGDPDIREAANDFTARMSRP